MPDIRYQFVSSGADDVKGAFRGIEASARAAEKATQQRSRASGTALSAEERRYKEVERYAAKVEQQLKREADAAQREAKRKADAAAREAKRGTDAEAREAKRAADASAKEAQRAAEAKIKAHEHVFQIRARYEAQQRRMEERAAAASARLYDRRGIGIRASNARDIQKNDERFMSLARSGSRFAFGAAATLGVGLGVVGGVAREGMRLQDASTRLAINARGAGEEAADPTILRREFEAAAQAHPGVKAADLAEAAQGFVGRTGDLGAARRFTGTFASVASASGAAAQDVAGTGADLMQKFGLKTVDEMREGLTALYMQGKAGAFELKDAAAQFAKIGAAAERFGGMKGVEGLKTLGGLTQLTRAKVGSPEQAATSVEAMFRQVIGNSAQIKGLGVDVFEKGSKSKTRGIQDILVETVAKAGGGQQKLQKIFGEEGIRAVSPLISTFNEAKEATKGTEAERTAAGIKAMREMLDKAINAGGTFADVQRDEAMAQQTASAQLEGAWESLKAQVADRTIPSLVSLVPKLAGLVDGIDPLITIFATLTDATSGFIDLLKSVGIIANRSEARNLRPPEELRAIREELDKAEKISGPLTAEQQAELAGKRLREKELAGELGVTDQRKNSPLATMLEGFARDNSIDALRQYGQRAQMEVAGGAEAPGRSPWEWLTGQQPEGAAERVGGQGKDRIGQAAGAAPTIDTSKLQAALDGLAGKVGSIGRGSVFDAPTK